MDHQTLCCDGSATLYAIATTPIVIVSQCSADTLRVLPWKLIRLLRGVMASMGITVHGVNLEGSAATACIVPSASIGYVRSCLCLFEMYACILIWSANFPLIFAE